MVVAPASSEDKAPGKTIAPSDFAGHWETAPFKQRDRTVVQRLELEVDRDGKVRGTFIERTTQGLPLASWSERFCDGADRWEWVTQWKLEGRVSGRKATLEGDDGDNILCTCPSKCTRPKDKLGFDLVYGVTGVTLHLGDRSFERR